MKKVLFSFLASLFSVAAFAQAAEESVVFAGPKAGVNVSNALIYDETAGQSIIGGHLGGLLNFKIDKHHSVQAEGLFSQKGFNYAAFNARINLNYAELPVLYQYHFTAKKKAKASSRKKKNSFYLTAGPQLSLLISSKATPAKTQLDDLTTTTQTGVTDLYSYTRPFDFSGVFGLGYTLKNGLSFETRYAMGFREISGQPNPLIPGHTTNSTLQAGFSYLLPIK
jgi:hypothetical protein